MATYLHVYAGDGFESAHTSERAANEAAKRGSRRRPGVRYCVVEADASGTTGGGRGHIVAEYRDGKLG